MHAKNYFFYGIHVFVYFKRQSKVNKFDFTYKDSLLLVIAITIHASKINNNDTDSFKVCFSSSAGLECHTLYVQGPVHITFFFGKCLKKTAEHFLIFLFLFESTILPVNNAK